jgi:hypothetical protein
MEVNTTEEGEINGVGVEGDERHGLCKVKE